MNDEPLIISAFLGVLEGLTEFIPVSSTGHLLLAGHFLGFESTGKTFEVLIQLGAILALLAVYAAKLWGVATGFFTDPAARRFVLAVLLAFLPAAFAGVLLHDFIKTVLFETPLVIAVSLIFGGVVLIWVDRRAAPDPVHRDAMRYPPWLALAIGCWQCLALIPGVSRSGATIVGALLLGADRRSAAEFSFFLSMPTMTGAFTYDLYQNRALLDMSDAVSIGIGFVTAFFAGLLVVRFLLDFVARYGFAVFGWWRILVGGAALVGLWATGGI
ncbi:MAG: undecaprenyl-diphosphate phosphatase [Pseudomonadota bacterium]